jgi:outer membrane protein insertion porin family
VWAGLLLAGLAHAQGPGEPPTPVTPARPDSAAPPEVVRRIRSIRVVGNVSVDSARVVRTFEVLPGSRFSAEAIQRGIRKLYTLHLFEDVIIDETRVGESEIDITIRVVERPRIGTVRFEGNKKRENDDLEKKLFLKAGEAYSPTAVQTQVDTLVQYYKDEGFSRVQITARTDTAEAGKVGLTFVVNEGERVRITKVEFRGNSAIPAKKLSKQLATKKKGFFGGGEIKDETFAEDQEKIAAHYRNHGYRDARVTGFELVPGKKARDLTLVFSVEEGRPYKVGTARWVGNTVLSAEALGKLWTEEPGNVYDQSKIQRAQSAAYGEYAEVGYLYLGIEPQETVSGDTVHVTFTVTEGAPSNVRMVQITGNQATREKVIRRELDIHEGDRFKRSLLVRSQGDIFRLGFFEDVQLDFVPADSTDVDITLKVKEKQVGTASAGAGYTAQGGFTGFLELGHNNVLGNGQSLSLHLERGAKRSDYQIGFTEPWFRDTPTLLGFTAFNTNRELDLYDDKRRGGSGRIGRPLPWPDYSRASLAYSLEDVTIRIDKDPSAFTPQDSIVLRGLKNGEPVLTSSVQTYFLRNSTDNPFYPTKGSKFTWDTELAGGPWGGSVSFHKHRVEMKAYFPSLLKGVTTMVRSRFGFLGEYADQHSSVPPYERFRLGGGTTPDPLRGYDDYMVVPKEFIRSVPIAFRDSTVISGTDTTTVKVPSAFGLVRYPGGRFMTLFSLEQQFPIAHPLHGVLFFDAGNSWDRIGGARPFDLKMSAGVGIRLEIPLLGNIGFDYAYGFHRRDLGDRPKFVGHFLIGQTSF